MPRVGAEIPNELARQIERMIRDGWFPDQEAVLREALNQFVDAKSFLGDSPRMLHRFAADALNDSKPEVALKFITRAMSLMSNQKVTDFVLAKKRAGARQPPLQLAVLDWSRPNGVRLSQRLSRARQAEGPLGLTVRRGELRQPFKREHEPGRPEPGVRQGERLDEPRFSFDEIRLLDRDPPQ